jgi:hypothetical protein
MAFRPVLNNRKVSKVEMIFNISKTCTEHQQQTIVGLLAINITFDLWTCIANEIEIRPF